MCAASQAVMYLVSVRPEAVNPYTILVGNDVSCTALAETVNGGKFEFVSRKKRFLQTLGVPMDKSLHISSNMAVRLRLSF